MSIGGWLARLFRGGCPSAALPGDVATAAAEPAWQRPYYQDGGGEPFLFYVVYGRMSEEATPSRSRYRFASIPQGVDVVMPDAQVCAGFREGYLWTLLQGTEGETAAAVEQAPGCIVLRGEPRPSNTLGYLRDMVGFITCLLDNGGVAVYDAQMFRLWSAGEWRAEIFEPAAPVPRRHVTILVSEEARAGLSWYHTRGMRKFGRPDLSVHDVSQQHAGAVVELINRFIEMQALGAIIPEGQEIRVASLPEGMTCHHGGDLDDPDFNNVHLEIRWPGAGR